MAETFFEEIKRYVRFGDEDARALRAAAPALARHINPIVEVFYTRLSEHAQARAVLADDAQIERLKGTLRAWLAQFLAGPYDDAYFQLRSRIGRTHVRVGLPPRYMFTAMEVIEAELDRALAHEFSDAETVAAATAAIHKLVALELAIMIETYQEDFNARTQRAEREARALLVERLDEVERRYREVVDGSGALVIVLDGERRIRFLNGKAEEACGARLADVEGRDWVEEFVPDDWKERTREALAVRLRGGVPDDAVRPLRARDGQVRWIRWFPTTPAPRGGLLYKIGLDVTAVRGLEQRAQRSERLALAGTLAAGLAHEVRNPLNAAVLQLQLLDRRLGRLAPDSQGETAPIVRTIGSELTRLARLVTEFMEFARPRPLDRRPGDIAALLDDVAHLMAPDAEAAGIRVAVDHSAALPPVRFDAERMRQILINLVRNALEAMAGGGALALRSRVATGAVEIDVEDSGPGLDAGQPIFDAFYTTKPTGTGLGLAIVHRLITEHGGEVRVESRPGRTVFTVSLPT